VSLDTFTPMHHYASSARHRVCPKQGTEDDHHNSAERPSAVHAARRPRKFAWEQAAVAIGQSLAWVRHEHDAPAPTAARMNSSSPSVSRGLSKLEEKAKCVACRAPHLAGRISPPGGGLRPHHLQRGLPESASVTVIPHAAR